MELPQARVLWHLLGELSCIFVLFTSQRFVYSDAYDADCALSSYIKVVIFVLPVRNLT